MTQPQLFAEVAVGCIFCPTVIPRHDPNEAHAAMEQHYQDRHQPEIERIVNDHTPHH